MSALDAFLTELRVAAHDRLPEHIETIEAAFHTLETAASPRAIADRDRIARIAGLPLPLVERLQLLADLMRGRLQ